MGGKAIRKLLVLLLLPWRAKNNKQCIPTPCKQLITTIALQKSSRLLYLLRSNSQCISHSAWSKDQILLADILCQWPRPLLYCSLLLLIIFEVPWSWTNHHDIRVAPAYKSFRKLDRRSYDTIRGSTSTLYCTFLECTLITQFASSFDDTSQL